MAVNAFNPNTGKPLAKGETVTIKGTNTSVTQGATGANPSGGGGGGSAAPAPVAVPSYGSTIVDTQGRSGTALFDPNTGKPLTPGPVTTQTDVGTLTTIPKSNVPVPVAGSTIVDTMGRSGIAAFDPNTGKPLAAPVVTPPVTPMAIPGLPQYPMTLSTPASTITSAYQSLLSSIDQISARISSAATPSDEEQRLSKELAQKKDQLSKFDIESMQATENLYGQGRGKTLGTIGISNSNIQRTRALERLGLAQEAETLTNNLGMAENNRQQLGALAQTEYNLAKSKLDIAMNVTKEMDKVHSDEQDNARQYLLDVVNFAKGKTFSELDPATQAAITTAVAHSPITLGMVQTALQSGADSAAAQDQGRQFQVAGLGVVQVNKDGSGYKVVVPANPTDHTSPKSSPKGTPSFNDYVAAQNLPLPSLTQDRLAKLRTEYDAKYGNTNTTGVKLSSDNIANGAQNAGLTVDAFKGQPFDVQNFFAHAPQKQLDAVNAQLENVRTGSLSIADAKAWIDASAITPAMKEYLKQKVDQVPHAAHAGGGNDLGTLLHQGWDAIANFFNL